MNSRPTENCMPVRLLPVGATAAAPLVPGTNIAQGSVICVQSAVTGMSSARGGVQVALVPVQVPPPAGLVAFGKLVSSVASTNEITPRGTAPRTQNEMP